MREGGRWHPAVFICICLHPPNIWDLSIMRLCADFSWFPFAALRFWPHSGTFVVLQSSAASPGSLPAVVGRCSVSPCPGSVTAGRRVTTRVTKWTVLVSIADRSPFTASVLPNNRNRIEPWKEYPEQVWSGGTDHNVGENSHLPYMFWVCEVAVLNLWPDPLCFPPLHLKRLIPRFLSA